MKTKCLKKKLQTASTVCVSTSLVRHTSAATRWTWSCRATNKYPNSWSPRWTGSRDRIRSNVLRLIFEQWTILINYSFHNALFSKVQLHYRYIAQFYVNSSSVCFSDHHLLTCRLGVPLPQPVTTSYTYRSLRKIDTTAFSVDILQSRLYGELELDADGYALVGGVA